jgi:hypothetical protein
LTKFDRHDVFLLATTRIRVIHRKATRPQSNPGSWVLLFIGCGLLVMAVAEPAASTALLAEGGQSVRVSAEEPALFITMLFLNLPLACATEFQ